VAIDYIKVVIWNIRTFHIVLDVFLKIERLLYVGLVIVYLARGVASKCHSH
jgi:hypothetical protein